MKEHSVMINYLRTSVIFTLCCSLPVCAIELNLGLQLTTNNINVRDESDQNIAQINNKLALSPTVSLLSKGYYLSEQSALGVQFQLDGNLVNVNRQTLHQNNQLPILIPKYLAMRCMRCHYFFTTLIATNQKNGK